MAAVGAERDELICEFLPLARNAAVGSTIAIGPTRQAAEAIAA